MDNRRRPHLDRLVRRLLEECDLLKDGIALMDTPDGEPLSAEDRDRLFQRSLRAMMAQYCRDEPGKALTGCLAMVTQLRFLADEDSSERCDPPAKRSEPKL